MVVWLTEKFHNSGGQKEVSRLTAIRVGPVKRPPHWRQAYGACQGTVTVGGASVSPGDVVFGDPDRLFLIAGPCVIENVELCLSIAERTQKLCAKLGVGYVFKASYDKANRSSISAYRGPGPEEGLRVLEKVRTELGCPILSDVHESGQVAAAAEVLDALQIPAFLCRQTDLLVAAAT